MTHSRNILSALAHSGVVATSIIALMAPSVALAVPAGGYGDLVEPVSPRVVLIGSDAPRGD